MQRSLRWLRSAAGLLAGVQACGCMDQVEARAGADRAVDGGDVVTLDASGSSPKDRDRIAFRWEVVEGPAVTFSDSTAMVATFTAPRSNSESRIVVQLTATYVDLSGQPFPPNSDRDEVLIRVRADMDFDGSTEPVAAEGDDQAAPDIQGGDTASTPDDSTEGASTNGT